MADDVITFKQNAIIDTLETMEQKRKNEQVAAKIGERQVGTIKRGYPYKPKMTPEMPILGRKKS